MSYFLQCLFPTIHSYSLFSDPIMLLIPLVERIVGAPMSVWPRIVLQYLCTLPPTSFSSTLLASFFCGNGLPCLMALQLVRVCHTADTTFHQTEIQSLYDQWHNSPHTLHFYVYWNLRVRRYLWLNGSQVPLHESVILPLLDFDSPLRGFDNYRGNWIHTRRLHHLRRTVLHVTESQ